MRTRQQSTKGWVIFAAFCAVLFCMTVLRACAAKTAPEGCSLERVRPTQAVCFPLGTNGWRVSDAYGWRTDPLTGEETFHRGTDLACAEGTRVLAAMDGVVSAARRSTTYGNYLRLSHSGGQETLYTRIRETIHPNGFSFKAPSSGWTESPTDAQLAATANWSLQFDPKAIPIASLITNG